jgi:hypothetical protein
MAKRETVIPGIADDYALMAVRPHQRGAPTFFRNEM